MKQKTRFTFILAIVLFLCISFVHALNPVIYGVNNTDIVRSLDNGITFNSVYNSASYDFDRIATTTDGRVIVAISNKGYNISNPSKILYSLDFGDSWSESPSSYPLMTDIAISDAGYLYITNCTHAIRAVFDIVMTFTSSSSLGFTPCTLGDNRGIATTADGSIVYAYENQVLKKNSLYGSPTNWSTIKTLGVGQFEGICTSDNGAILYAYPYNAQPSISNNSGVTYFNGAYSGTTLLWNENSAICKNHEAIIGDTSNNIIYSPDNMIFGTSTQQPDTVIDMITATNNFDDLWKVNSTDIYTSGDDGATWTYVNTIGNLSWIAVSDGLSYNTVDTSNNFQTSLDTINAILQADGTWYTYPYGIPLQSYATVRLVSNNETGYVGIQCNYNESSQFSDYFEYDNITTNGWTGACANYFSIGSYNPTYYKSIYINGTALCGVATKQVGEFQNAKGYTMTLTVYPLTDGSIELSLNNLLSTLKVANVILDYDEPTSQLCLYHNTKNLLNTIVCESYNNTINGDITINMDVNNFRATYTLSMTTNGGTSYSENLLMINGNESYPQTIGWLSVEPSSTFTGFLDNINITKHGYFPDITYFNISEGVPDAYYQGCAYGQIYNVPIRIRTYYQPTNLQVWNNYQDISILPRTQQQQNVDGNGTGTFDQNTQNFVDMTFGSGLSAGAKLFYAIVITFIALILVVILGIYVGMPPALTGGLSVIVVISSLIMFAFLGFIPVWIIILLGIIGAGVVAMFFKGMVAT